MYGVKNNSLSTLLLVITSSYFPLLRGPGPIETKTRKRRLFREYNLDQNPGVGIEVDLHKKRETGEVR